MLKALGGAEGLRSRLSTPGTTVRSLNTERALITLGEWPEAGDSERGLPLPVYRELARVLEPWLFHAPLLRDETATDALRWTRRFLD